MPWYSFPGKTPVACEASLQRTNRQGNSTDILTSDGILHSLRTYACMFSVSPPLLLEVTSSIIPHRGALRFKLPHCDCRKYPYECGPSTPLWCRRTRSSSQTRRYKSAINNRPCLAAHAEQQAGSGTIKMSCVIGLIEIEPPDCEFPMNDSGDSTLDYLFSSLAGQSHGSQGDFDGVYLTDRAWLRAD